MESINAAPAEQARLRCRLASELEEAGKYEAARSCLSPLWQRVGERPELEGLDEATAAEVLLRVGALSGWLGSARQLEGAQAVAKDLISESLSIFESLGNTEKAVEARIDLAICYWREGALDEARVLLRDALSRLGSQESVQKARAFLNSAVVEGSATRYHEALQILSGAAPLFDASTNHTLKGKFHNELALNYKNLGAAERRRDYTDRALIEYAAASFHFEQAGHMRYCARVENNLGFLFFILGQYEEAHAHLDRSRELFSNLRDEGSAAQVDETRARVLLAQGRNFEAERMLRAVIRTLEKGGEQSLLAEALTTEGKALARLGRTQPARAALERALELAYSAGDSERAGQAALTLIEELSEHLNFDALRALYERADELLARSEHTETLVQLRSCARVVFAARRRAESSANAPRFVYQSERTAELLREARAVAATDGAVLITGETGTGKEILARLIHLWSGREGDFISVNCAAFTDTLFESQLFGHKKGSFTDAKEDYPGAARAAAGGTLFLDEIGELSLSHQGKLLRLIEHGEIHSLGTFMPEKIDLRVIAATNSNLREMVSTGRFRQDLFYRLETFFIEVPPLRERPEDIPPLARHFIEAARSRYTKQVVFTDEAIEAMRQLPLRGNARELHSLIERTMLTAADGTLITVEMVETVALRRTQPTSLAACWDGFSLKREVHRYEERFIELALREAGGMVTRAARLLGFRHHESLSSLLKTKHQKLQPSRMPAAARKRSIISKR
jgi:transcriptional regulator with GAF, ATPase, and Fis domain